MTLNHAKQEIMMAKKHSETTPVFTEEQKELVNEYAELLAAKTELEMRYKEIFEYSYTAVSKLINYRLFDLSLLFVTDFKPEDLDA